MSNQIDVGDTVLHGPSGERWIVAAVDGGRLYWCGYPFGGSADLADCVLVDKATDAERKNWLIKIADGRGDERPRRLARESLGLVEQVKQEPVDEAATTKANGVVLSLDWDKIDDDFDKFLEGFHDVDGEKYERRSASDGGRWMKYLIRQAMKTEMVKASDLEPAAEIARLKTENNSLMSALTEKANFVQILNKREAEIAVLKSERRDLVAMLKEIADHSVYWKTGIERVLVNIRVEP